MYSIRYENSIYFLKNNDTFRLVLEKKPVETGLRVDNNKNMQTGTPSPFEHDDTQTVGVLYSFFALTMQYPQAELCSSSMLDMLETMTESMDWQEELAQLRAWRNTCPSLLDDLQIEYTRLFINAVPHTPVPPYASIYMDGDGTLQGRTTEKIRDFYRERGFDVASEAEPADHISQQLHFLAALAVEGRSEDEALFLKTLFRPWFVRFRKRCAEETRHPFFRTSIRLIDIFTKEEQ